MPFNYETNNRIEFNQFGRRIYMTTHSMIDTNDWCVNIVINLYYEQQQNVRRNIQRPDSSLNNSERLFFGNYFMHVINRQLKFMLSFVNLCKWMLQRFNRIASSSIGLVNQHDAFLIHLEFHHLELYSDGLASIQTVFNILEEIPSWYHWWNAINWLLIHSLFLHARNFWSVHWLDKSTFRCLNES